MLQSRISVVFIAFLSLALLWSGSVAAEMLISPTRISMSSDERTAELVLRNTSDGSRTYRLSWENKRVNSKGQYEMVGEDEEWPSASDMLRFSPRQITVGPNENQTVRLNFRPSDNLAPGEYRSHLLLGVVAGESEPTSVIELEDPNREGVGFNLFMQMSFSIPVVVRHKVQPPEVSISKIDVAPRESNASRLALDVELSRTGKASSFGQIVVEMQEDRNSPVQRIGLKKGIYVFPETDKKTVRVALRDLEIPANSYIRVAYEGVAEYEGRLWDEQIFQNK